MVRLKRALGDACVNFIGVRGLAINNDFQGPTQKELDSQKDFTSCVAAPYIILYQNPYTSHDGFIIECFTNSMCNDS